MRYKKAFDDHAMEVGYLVACEGMSEKEAEIKAADRAVVEHLIRVVMRRKCDNTGHAFVDESHGGPESGYMGGTCKRCGFSFHHTLY